MKLLHKIGYFLCPYNHQGPVVQSIVSLTTSLRGHLFKYIPTTLSNTLLFFVGKMRESFAMQKILSFFQQKICNINVLNFNETLTNNIVNFEQLAPVLLKIVFRTHNI